MGATLTLFTKGAGEQLSPNFNQTEIDCRCKSKDCHFALQSPVLIEKRQALRDDWGSGIKSNSGFRCIIHNDVIGGTDKSFHTKGMADDLAPSDLSLLDEFEEMCRHHFPFVLRYDTFCHCDTRGA